MRPAGTKAVVFPVGDRAAESKVPAPLAAAQSGAWAKAHGGHSRSAMVGIYLPPFEDAEPCCLCLSARTAADRFVTARLGPVGLDGLILHQDSVKVTGEWRAGEDLEWLIRNVPLRQMAARSASGLVACRFKIWAQSRLSRRWVGRTMPLALPAPPHVVRVGELELLVAACRGAAAEGAVRRGARVMEYAVVAGATPNNAPAPATTGQSQHAEFLGREIVRIVAERQWGVAAALLHELRLAPEEKRRKALAEVDGTRRTALRMCVDGQREERAPLLQALEKGTLTAVLGVRRPYWWSMRIDKVCHRTLSFLGRVWIGMPRFHAHKWQLSIASARPWTAGPAHGPDWMEVQWSEAQECRGTIEAFLQEAGEHTSQLGHLRMGDDTELTLRRIEPGESATFGPGTLRNPLALPMVAAHGRIAGALASGMFDFRACARLAAEGETCGPREAAALAVSSGADPRALADDGLSPYTAALLGEDPCSLLVGLDPALRVRILRGDAHAWAEASRSRAGAGHPDMVAAPLTRGLLVPDELAQGLLDYCFRADLPLLAVRALARVDGQNYLLPAIERASDPQWLRAAERILQQTRSGTPRWCSGETLTYAVAQVRRGRQQFGLLLSAFLARLRKGEDFYTHPAALAGDGGTECPICFEPLCRGNPVAFVDEDGHAVCPHFLCASCARGYAASAASTGSWLRCPECRRSAPKAVPLPRLGEDPLGWFDFLAGTEGAMARSALVRAISAMLPVDADRLSAAMDDGSLMGGPMLSQEAHHEITAAEFLAGGLYAWVWHHEDEHQRCSVLGPLPDLTDRAEWFRYWNLSRSGNLTRGEVLRAVLRTLEVSSMDKPRVAELRRRVDRAWDSAAAERWRSQGHCNAQSVTSAEFCEADGLGDALEEAFGMDLAKGGSASSQPGEAGFPLGPQPLQLWGRAAGGHRQKRGEAAPPSVAPRPEAAPAAEALQPEVAPRPPLLAPPDAAAGVLGMLEPELQSPLPVDPGGGGTGSRALAAGGAPPREPPPAGAWQVAAARAAAEAGGYEACGPQPDLDPMAALEGLERDLAQSARRSTIISL